jgi:hypothetical protein
MPNLQGYVPGSYSNEGSLQGSISLPLVTPE